MPRKPKDPAATEAAAVNFANLMEQTGNKDPDIVEQAMLTVKSALVATRPQIPNPDQVGLIVVGLNTCLVHKNGRVRDAAVACIAPLSSQAPNKDALVLLAVDLCKNLSGEYRDTANLGLRALLSDNGLRLPGGVAPVVEALAPQLIAGIKAQDKLALAHLQTLLLQFGALCSGEHARIRDDLFALLTPETDEALSFLVSCCCGALTISCGRDFVADMATTAMAKLESGTPSFGLVLSRIASMSGRKLGPGGPALIERLNALLDAMVKEDGGSDAGDGEDSEEEDDGDGSEHIIVSALAAVSAIAANCSKYCKGLECTTVSLQKASALVSFSTGGGALFGMSDGEDSDDGADAYDDDDSDGNETEDNDDLEDDDDLTWKVRAEAAKCMTALAMLSGHDDAARADAVSTLCERIADEPSTAVKSEIYSACDVLLRPNETGSSDASASIGGLISTLVTNEIVQKTQARGPALVLLKSLASNRPGCLSSSIASGVLSDGMATVMQSSSSELKLSCLDLMRTAAADGGASVWTAAMKTPLGTGLVKCLSVTDTRLRTAAFMAAGSLAAFVESEQAATILETVTDLLKQDASAGATVEAAMLAASSLVNAHPGSPAVASCVEQMLSGLSSESTQLCAAALHTFELIATGPAELGASLAIAVQKLSDLIRAKRSESDTRASIKVLVALADAHASRMGGAALIDVVVPLVAGSDIEASAMALQLCARLLAADSGLVNSIQSSIWQHAYALLCSSSLNDSARKCASEFCVALVRAGNDGFGFDFIVKACNLAATGKKVSSTTSDTDISRHALKSFGFCIGSMAAAAPQDVRDNAIAAFVKALLSLGKQVNANDGTWTCDESAIAVAVLSLRALGEIGAVVDLSAQSDLQEALLSAMEKQTSAEIRSAAIDATAGVCVGNLPAFKPFLAKAITQTTSLQLKTRMLQVLRDLSAKTAGALDKATFLPILFAESASSSQEVRQIVSQCLGNISTEAEAIVDFEARLASATDGLTKQTIIQAVRQNVTTAKVDFDLAPFLVLSDADFGVRAQALLLLKAAIRNMPSRVAPLLPALFPVLCACAPYNSSLVDVIDLGGMKHLADRGIGMRKAAFEVLEAIEENVGAAGAVGDLVDSRQGEFMHTVGLGLVTCGVTEVTLFYKVGKGVDDTVCIIPPNSAKGIVGGPAPGYAAFVADRSSEVAAALGIDVGAIEVVDVKKSGKSQFKDAGVVEFCFIFRLPDSLALVENLKAEIDSGGGKVASVAKVPLQLHDEAAKDGGLKLLQRQLDSDGIEEVALIIVAHAARRLCDDLLPHVQPLLELLSMRIQGSSCKSDEWLATKEKDLDAKLAEKKTSPTQCGIDKAACKHEERMQSKRVAVVALLRAITVESCAPLEALANELSTGPLARMFLGVR